MYEYMNTTSAMENLTLDTSFSKCYTVRSMLERNKLQLFYLAIIIVSIPSNTFSLYVSWQYIRQKNELGVYLFNLALSDLAFTIGLCMWLDFLRRGVWVHGPYVCVLCISMLFSNFYTSDALLCCIAVDRYLAVVHPLQYTFLRKVGTAVAVSIVIWVLVVCFNVTTITWEELYHENKFPTCFDFYLPISERLARANVARFFLAFIVPVLLVVFSTVGICEAVKSNQATEKRERKRILKLLTVVMLCHLIFLGPTHITMLLTALVDDCSNAQWLFYLHEVSLAMSSLNCLMDPVLYCFITKIGKANVDQLILFFQIKKRSNNQDVV